MTRRLLAGLVVSLLVLGSCRIETASAPTGDTTLYATFDDVQDLTPGHDVQAANVQVGSVQHIRLRGYRAEVELSIIDDFKVPEGTAAVVRRTSLLGEYYVDLVLPEGFDPEAATFLGDQDQIEDATTQPDVEQLAEQATALVGSLTAEDLAATVDAVAEGLNGRGEVLHDLVQDAGAVAAALEDQKADLATVIDQLAALGSQVAPGATDLASSIDQLAAASGEIAGSRDRIVATVDALVGLAATTNDVVLEPHAERLAVLLQRLDPILGALAGRSDVLADLIVDLDRFTTLFPTAVHNGSVLLLAWAFLDVPALIGQGAPAATSASVPAGDPLGALAQLVGGAP